MNRLFTSMVSMVLIRSVLSIVKLSRWCLGYSLGVSCQSSICLHGVNGTHRVCLVHRLIISRVSIVYLSPCVTATHWECLVNRLFISFVSMVLTGGVNRLFISIVPMVLFGHVLSIVYLSPWFHGYSLGVSCQSSNFLHGVIGTHWECLVNRLITSMVSILLIAIVLSTIY